MLMAMWQSFPNHEQSCRKNVYMQSRQHNDIAGVHAHASACTSEGHTQSAAPMATADALFARCSKLPPKVVLSFRALESAVVTRTPRSNSRTQAERSRNRHRMAALPLYETLLDVV